MAHRSKQPGAPSAAIDPKSLRYFGRLKTFREALARATAIHGLPSSFHDPKRLLSLGDYLSLFLFGLFNPVCRTMRGLCKASNLKRVSSEVCSRRVSLGSFSEAQSLVDLKVLEHVFADLASQASPTGLLPAHLQRFDWIVQDGSLFAALPRMSWALYGCGFVWPGNSNPYNAVRLHLGFNLLTGSPEQATVTPGRNCERAAWKEHWKPGAAYVGDRYFGENYKLFGLLRRMGCHFVIRLMDSAVITVLEEFELTEKQREAGILKDQKVRLGGPRHLSEVLRVITLRGQSGQILLLATDLEPEQLAAQDVALIYKHRWQIEYFFKWVKCVLGCGHWIAEAPKGAAIQLYLALIGALLLQLHLGRRPSKRVFELFQFHLMGMVEEDELADLLARQLGEEEKARAAKKRA